MKHLKQAVFFGEKMLIATNVSKLISNEQLQELSACALNNAPVSFYRVCAEHSQGAFMLDWKI